MLLRSRTRLGRFTSTISMPASPQGSRRPGAIGASPFDSDLGHLAEALEPGQQGLVAGSISREGFGADQAAERVECRSNVVVEVGVEHHHGIPGGASTIVIAVPTFLNVDGDGTAVPDQGDGRFDLLAQAGPITLLWDGTCRFQSAAGRVRPTTPEGRLMTPESAKSPMLQKLLRTSCQAVDPLKAIVIGRGHL